jgi:hypothetical protein
LPRRRGAHFSKSLASSSAALLDTRLTTSVKPMPKVSSAASWAGRRVSAPRPLRARSLSRDDVNAGQKRFVVRAK